MRAGAVFLIGIAGAAVVAAEQNASPRASVAADIAVPSLGFVTEDAQLRPLLGSKAFPARGEVVALVADAKRILLAGKQKYALVETSEGWTAVPVGRERFPATRVLDRQARLAVLSPSGTAAAFLIEGANTVVAVTGLPASPAIAFESKVDEGILSLAISDDGRKVLTGRPGAVLVLQRDQATAAIQADTPTAIAFQPNGSRALVADRDANQILTLDITDGGSTVSRLAGNSEGVDAPVAVAYDSGGANALVLNRSSVAVLPLNGGLSRILHCDFKPAELESLAEERLFAIRAQDGAGTWLLRMDTPEPVLLYAPSVER